MFSVIVRLISRSLMVILLLGFALVTFLFVDYTRFLQTPMVIEESSPTLVVKSGDSVGTLIKTFEANHLPLAAESPFSKALGPYYFRYLAKSREQAHQLKIGEFALTKGMRPTEVLDLLVSGKTIAYTVQFIEGWQFSQLRQTLANNTHIKQTLANVDDRQLLHELGISQYHHVEGLFFPDTYQFPQQTSDREILQQAYQLMQKNLDKAWQARDKNIQLQSPYELLILASIIEKETPLPAERPQVSGVFHRRLAKGMPLQTDPTVIYGMGSRYQGTIYRSDLKKDTPYNTYTRKGLPPTPIAMPSMASLMAAGQPDNGQALYFVADGKGGHRFSKTYQQHLKAVKAYRKQQQP